MTGSAVTRGNAVTQPKVIGTWLAMFHAALNSRGVDAGIFLQRRGIDFEYLVDPEQRVHFDTMAKLWRDAVDLTCDDAFGLHAGTFVSQNTFGALSTAMSTACTVEDHIRCMVRFGGIFATMAEASVVAEGDELVYTSPVPRNPSGQTLSSPWSQDAICSAMHHLRRQQFGELYRPLGFVLARPEPADPATFERFFGCPVFYDADSVCIRMELVGARTRAPGSSPVLARATERLAAEFLAQHYHSGDLLGDLRQALLLLLPEGESRAEVMARDLNMSPRTLQRRLEALGTSYGEQLEQYRYEMACRYLQDHSLTVGEIGDLLGFASNASFTRAFKRWSGTTPRSYRDGAALSA